MVEAAKTGNVFPDSKADDDGDEARNVFFQLVGASINTQIRIIKSLAGLGSEIVSPVRRLGLPWREVRLLAESSAEIKGQVRALVESGEASREVLEVLVGKIIETKEAEHATRDHAREAAGRSHGVTSLIWDCP